MQKSFTVLSDLFREMFKNYKFKGRPLYNNNCLTFEFGKDRFVELRVITTGTSKKYTGIQLKLIHKQNGEVSNQFFSFKDYLEPVKPLHPNIPETTHIWDNDNEIAWYGNEPTDDSVRDLTNAIMRYLEIADYKE